MADYQKPGDDRVRPTTIEDAIAVGDFGGLTDEERATHYQTVCDKLGLNATTGPFAYLNLNGKMRLYALRDCTDQLRKLHGISLYITNRERVHDLYVVTCRARDRTGREDESTGAVAIGNLKGEALANALMKGETKAKRRVTLSIAGLGMLDEVEVESIDGARPITRAIGHEGLLQAPDAVENPVQRENIRPQTQRISPSGPSRLSAITADQIEGLIELAQSTGHDHLELRKYLRQSCNLPSDVKLTRDTLPQLLTIEQYEQAYAHFSALLKAQVEGETSAPDEMPVNGPRVPQEEGTSTEAHTPGVSGVSLTGEAGSTGPYATPKQIADLKELAAKVGDDAVVEVQDALEHHRQGFVLPLYTMMTERLQRRKAEKAQAEIRENA